VYKKRKSLNENYTIYTASNDEDGIKIAKRVKPSLITLDIMMPHLDGWEVLKRLKMSTETEDIPVILISNATNESKGRVLGAIETLSKPLSQDELKNVINKHFTNSKCQKVLIVDDEKDTRDLIREHIGDDVIHIEDARDGKEALAVINNGFVPDLIYLDLMMPNFSGFEFLELAKTKQILKDTHIVIVTAKDLTKEDIEILQRNDVSIIKKGGNIEAIVKEFAQGKQ
jgi:CheY-like chemotaxis protein